MAVEESGAVEALGENREGVAVVVEAQGGG